LKLPGSKKAAPLPAVPSASSASSVCKRSLPCPRRLVYGLVPSVGPTAFIHGKRECYRRWRGCLRHRAE
jgi:hypothetical protein